MPASSRELRAELGIAAASAATAKHLTRPAEAIAPVTVWLASYKAANVNGQLFYVSGGLISLVSQPEPGRTVTKPIGERCTIEEFAAIIPATLGMDMSNPAPARAE